MVSFLNPKTRLLIVVTRLIEFTWLVSSAQRGLFNCIMTVINLGNNYEMTLALVPMSN